MIEFFTTFPEMSKAGLRLFKKTVDGAYRNFSREYGDAIESIFDPILYFLVWFEKLLQNSPWPMVILVFLVLIYFGSRSIYLTIGSFVALILIGYFGMWEDTMSTVSIIGVCTFISIGLGIPIGILMSGSDRARSLVSPVLDIMQTMPSFVYLIPVVMLLGIGKIPGLLAVVIYDIPQIMRLNDLGIREVDKEELEAAEEFGGRRRQKIFRVQLPLAILPLCAGLHKNRMMTPLTLFESEYALPNQLPPENRSATTLDEVKYLATREEDREFVTYNYDIKKVFKEHLAELESPDIK